MPDKNEIRVVMKARRKALTPEARKDAWKIGIAYAFQIVDDLPSESHDILLSKVIVT